MRGAPTGAECLTATKGCTREEGESGLLWELTLEFWQLCIPCNNVSILHACFHLGTPCSTGHLNPLTDGRASPTIACFRTAVHPTVHIFIYTPLHVNTEPTMLVY